MRITVACLIILLLVIGFFVEYTRNKNRDDNAALAWLAGIVISFIVLMAALGAQYARAHDHDRPDLNGWFQSLRSGKGPCCDGSDALSIDEPDWENNSGHYRVRLEGEWVDVPDDAVILQPNLDGRALVWPYRKDGVLNQIRCFIPGAGA